MATVGRSTVSWERLRGPASSGVDVLCLSQKDLAAHDHLFHELVFVVEGTGVHWSAAGREPLRPGSVVVLRPQVWHAYEKTQTLRIINCLVDSRLITRFGQLLSQVPGSFDLYRKRTRSPQHEPPTMLHMRPAQFRPVVDRLTQIMQELKQQREGWQASTILGAMDVLVSCARLAADGATRETVLPTEHLGRSHQAVLQAVAYIESNYNKAISLDELSGHVHLSSAHRSRSFTRHMGMNVVSFIHRLRLEEACRLLKATSLPITYIAAVVGYDEIAYFSRCFRQQLGMSPRAYRQHDGKPLITT